MATLFFRASKQRPIRTTRRRRCWPSTSTIISSNNTDDLSIVSASANYDTMPHDIDIPQLVQKYANRAQTPISLRQLWVTSLGDLDDDNIRNSAFLGRLGQRLAAERILMKVATMIYRELPIRLAHRIQDLDQVPKMRDMPSVHVVKGIYISSFLDLLQAPPPTTLDLEASFGELLNNLYKKHSNVLLQMAQGAFEFRTAVKQGQIPETQMMEDDARISFAQQEDCHRFLDRFYMSRVGIRVLAGQYLALRQQLLLLEDDDRHGMLLPHMDDNYVGMIYKHTSPYEIVQRAIQDATRLCLHQFGEAPSVVISGRLDLTFCYIPTHLHYILLELLKNAMRATMEFHADSEFRNRKPSVTVIIADGMENEDVIIKVMDEGGGIPRSQMDHIWSYLFTTADPNIQQTFLYNHNKNNQHASSPILAGLGYGLPMSRAYARYFGGDLDLISMEGYGTDAFCYLARLGDKAPSLPV